MLGATERTFIGLRRQIRGSEKVRVKTVERYRVTIDSRLLGLPRADMKRGLESTGVDTVALRSKSQQDLVVGGDDEEERGWTKDI